MGEAQRSLVVCDPLVGADELYRLLAQSPYLADSRVVHSGSELSSALRRFNPSIVVQVYRGEVDTLSPSCAIECVNVQHLQTPCIVTGPGLTEALATDLKALGVRECCFQRPDQPNFPDTVAALCAHQNEMLVTEAAPTMLLDDGQLFTSLGEGVLLVDPDLRIRDMNPALQKLTDQEASGLKGSAVLALDAGGLGRHLADCQRNQQEWRGIVKIRRQDASFFPAWAVISPLRTDSTTSGGFAVIVSDMSERLTREETYKRQASFDALTGLPNRALLQDRMLRVLAAAKRNKLGAAVMYVDLDHFKEANDTWGHAIGDKLLIESAKRMQACIRETDTVARIGGDEFVVVLTDIGEDHLAEKVASKIAGAIERPFLLESAGIYLSASIGIAIYPLHGKTPEELFANADAAMYEVKRNGRRGYRMYGDIAPVSDAVKASVHLGHEPSLVPEIRSLRQSIKEFVSRDFVIPTKLLIPAGAAALSLLLICAWLIASGTVGFHNSADGELMTDTEMNDFGTASGPDDDAVKLDSLGGETN